MLKVLTEEFLLWMQMNASIDDYVQMQNCKCEVLCVCEEPALIV